MPLTAKPLAFVSYSWADNQDGFVEEFVEKLRNELHVQSGEPANIFVDRLSLDAGDNWNDRLRAALQQSEFLIPFVTPSYLKSENTRRELEAYRGRGHGLDAIFPIHYVDALSAESADPLAQVLRKFQWIDWRKLRFEPWDSMQVRRAIQQLAEAILTAHRARKAETAPPAAREPLVLNRLQLENFRCFDELDLALSPPFRHASTLDGDWTCIAGINGAGKSSILQAISIALMGELAKELGGTLLARMRRSGMSPSERTSIRLTGTRGGKLQLHSIQIDNRGGLHTGLEPPPIETAAAVAYGATRNLSDDADSPYKNLSAPVQSMISLFRPLSQLASAEVLLSDRRRSPELVSLFSHLIDEIFKDSLTVETQPDSPALRFGVSGRDHIDATDLPDGFRSSAAWLADLCATWCIRRADAAASGDPSEIEAIVLIDEIDLHLHPTMQRELVPRLRKALPKVQWIVTTHSPLVLANFDANEIVALDRDKEGHIRRLDRQILGFSTDQIYEWLMGARPTSAAMDQILEESARNVTESSELAVAEMMRVSPESSTEDAHAQVSEFRDILRSLKR